MSLINKVLRDLDTRQTTQGIEPARPAAVNIVSVKAASHEWFWRSVAFLVLIALGWVGWVFYQIQPHPIATELAEQAAAKRAATPTPVAAAPVAPQPAAPQPVTPPAPAAVATPEPKPAAAAKPVPPPYIFRFAYSIDTPIGAPAPRVESKPKPQAQPKKAPVAEKPRFERRDVVLTPEEKGETEFRRGVDLLKRGRTMEAQSAFRTAVSADAGHRAARQALVALAMERGDLDDASRLLTDALARDPAQPDFAAALARIQVERGAVPQALATLDAASAAAGAHPDYFIIRGSVLQRLGRHEEATDAFRAALRLQSSTPAWLGLGISFEALQKKPEAANAFRNALAAGPANTELRTYAEQRIQALR